MSNVSMVDGHIDRPMTNYERIKNMSVEEMAGYLLDGQTYCPYLSFLEMENCEVKDCYECIKQWLRTEVKE